MFVALMLVCLRKDLTVFIKIASFGTISCLTLTVMILAFGIYAMVINKFEVDVVPYTSGHLALFSTNFASLAGVLGIAYFLHPVIIPICRANKHQDKNVRDVGLGYFYVYLTYITIGVFGYIGFSGRYFREYLERFNYALA